MDERLRGIFLSGSTPAETDTQATGEATLESRGIIEDSESVKERCLFIDCADDNSSTPTIQVKISLSFGPNVWSDWVEIEAASVVPKEIKISSYGKDWWLKNQGVKFQFTKAGAGAVTYTNARWI